MTDDASWGNPSTATFQKRRIRLVAVDDLRVQVHVALQPVVEKLLRDLSVTDLVVKRVAGYPQSPNGTGVLVQLQPDQPELVAKALQAAGFTREGPAKGMWTWGGTYEEAVEAGTAIDAERQAIEDAAAQATRHGTTPNVTTMPTAPPAAVATAVANVGDDGWYAGLPASRVLEPGAEQTGQDVLFLQAYLDVPRTAVYDPDTIAAVSAYMRRRGFSYEGRMGEDEWKQLIPRTKRYLRNGDGGRNVRLLSAALIACGWAARDAKVDAYFGIVLSRSIRDFQTARGHRRTGIVAAMDWAALVANPWVQELALVE